LDSLVAELFLEAFQLAEPSFPESVTNIPDEAERIEACLTLRGQPSGIIKSARRNLTGIRANS